MQQEVDALKLQLKEIALKEKQNPDTISRPNRFTSFKVPVPEILDYSVSEMQIQVDFDLPVTQKLIDKLT